MRFRSSSHTHKEYHDGQHRFEHWYRDNSIYFITSKVRDGKAMFESEMTRAIFWDRFDHYTALYGFQPWVTSLLNNHYHTVGYLKNGSQLGEMMRKLHGSIATLVMKEMKDRWVPFWRERGKRNYFDGCLRDVLQGTRTYRYVLMQAVRAGIAQDYRDYPHTRVIIDSETAIKRAVELGAFMEGVPYARYDKWRGKRRRGQQS